MEQSEKLKSTRKLIKKRARMPTMTGPIPSLNNTIDRMLNINIDSDGQLNNLAYYNENTPKNPISFDNIRQYKQMFSNGIKLNKNKERNTNTDQNKSQNLNTKPTHKKNVSTVQQGSRKCMSPNCWLNQSPRSHRSSSQNAKKVYKTKTIKVQKEQRIKNTKNLQSPRSQKSNNIKAKKKNNGINNTLQARIEAAKSNDKIFIFCFNQQDQFKEY